MKSPARALLACAVVASCAGSAAVDQRPSGPVATPSRAPVDVPNTSPVTPPDADTDADADADATVRLVFVGDVMLGRGVAPVVTGDPSSVFERLRPMIVDADLAFANLESPLTSRRHVSGEFALEAEPASAALLAGAGFDVLDLANNHATDAGPETVLDTVAALESVGLLAVGGGSTSAEAAQPLIVELDGVRIGTVAFDLSGGRPATEVTPGINVWDADLARATITELAASNDVVVVGLHGGVEYLPRPDPALDHIAGLVADWGADVVWGHGAHVPYAAEVRSGPLGTAVVAPGLGNALFDQHLPGTQTGAALEVLVDRDGVVAFRAGWVAIDAGRSSFDGWDLPSGDAVALDGEWWTPVRAWSNEARGVTVAGTKLSLPTDHVEVARASGDVTGTRQTDTVVAYRRPLSAHPIHDLYAERTWADPEGRSAHLAVLTDTGRMRWGSAVMFEPVGALEVCDGAIAIGFTTLDQPTIVAGGAWTWDGFGFRTAPVLPGPALVGCADIDLDGRSDPVLTGRSVSGDSTDPSTD